MVARGAGRVAIRATSPLAIGLALTALATAAVGAQQFEDLSGPAAPHEAFSALAGEWRAEVMLHGGGPEPVLAATGLAQARLRLGGRYLEVEISLEPGAPAQRVVYLIGFDRRNDRYQVVNLDDSATYLVMAEGAREEPGGWIAATGEDDDPNMAAMGFEKVFVFALDLDPEGGWAVQTRFVDTRTPERVEQPFMTMRMVR